MSDATGWPRIESLIVSRDHRALTEAMTHLDAADRKSFATPLAQLARRVTTDEAGAWLDGAILAIAAAGILPGASALATWLNRHGLSDGREWYHPEVALSWLAEDLAYNPGYLMSPAFDTPARYVDPTHEDHIVARVLRVLTHREVGWLPDLAARLAAKLRGRETVEPLFELIEQIRALTGLGPFVDSDGFVAQWLLAHSDMDSLRAALITDRRVAEILPRVFEIDAVAGPLGWSTDWPETFARCASSGVADRAAILDACIGRLQRGGRPGATKTWLSVHEAMAPTHDEVADRTRGYLALIPDSLSVVATMAQRVLRELDDLNRLPAEAVIAATDSALRRTEKKLVRAQLAWLATWAGQDAGSNATAARAATAVFEHSAVDLQRAGVDFVLGRAEFWDDDTRAEIDRTAGFLPLDLRQQLVSIDGEQPSVPAAPPAPPTPAPLALITSEDELAECLLVFLTADTLSTSVGDLERVLEAVVRYASTDREALRTALLPVTGHEFFPWLADRYEWDLEDDSCSGVRLSTALGELVGAALQLDRHGWVFEHCGHHIGVLDHVIVDRVLRIADALRSATVLGVVATPSWTDGLIDVAHLVERLEAAHRQGWEPEPVDLDQSLLRLDRTGTPPSDVLDQLAAIGTTAAQTTLEWLSRPTPRAASYRLVTSTRTEWDGERMAPAGAYTAVGVDQPAEPIDNQVWTMVFTPSSEPGISVVPVDYWASVLPMHREVVGAFIADLIASTKDLRGRLPALPMLAALHGEPGPALWLALAHAMAGKDSAPRIDAVDACLVLAARGQLDGRQLGTVIGGLIVERAIVITRLIPALLDAAAGGAGEQLWQVVSTVLGRILVSGTAPSSGMADLFAATAEIAAQTGSRGTIEGLTEFAARPGRSRQLVEARRLATLIDVSAPRP